MGMQGQPDGHQNVQQVPTAQTTQVREPPEELRSVLRSALTIVSFRSFDRTHHCRACGRCILKVRNDCRFHRAYSLHLTDTDTGLLETADGPPLVHASLSCRLLVHLLILAPPYARFRSSPWVNNCMPSLAPLATIKLC